ncbi:unnamed protein product [Staurois parvus]|uniref:Uncharacterized protein n=1 Tax=Staurois parvus TaxID=386267 RepID=A0ABN9CWJ8_9NEOB|nr:unnamed protein product [Staurois parvus]
MFSMKQAKPTFRSYLLPPQHEDKLSPETKIKKLKAILLPGKREKCVGRGDHCP